MRRIYLMATVLMFSLFRMSICAQEKLVYTPTWTAQAQFAGFYVADAMGFFKDAGLNVEIKHPTASNTNANRLKSGESHLVSLQLASALEMMDDGSQLVNVLQYFQQSGLMIISHQPMKGLNSLNGKRVGHFRTGASMFVVAIGRKAHLDIDWVPFISHANLYLSGAIDATLAMSYNEYFQLKAAGQRLKKEQIIYLRDIGYNVPEDGLYVTKDFFKKHREEVLKFAEATRRGWEWAAQHPKETLDLVMLYMRQNNVPSNVYAQRWMLEECLKLLTDPKTGKRTYRLDPQAFELTSRILYEGSIIKKPITYQQIMQP